MAQFNINGLDGLIMDLEQIKELPDPTAEKMLLAQANVIEKAQRETGRAFGVYRTGATLASITHSGMKRGANGDKEMYIYPQGVNARGTRNAEVAFINEYGAPERGIAARPFIRTANEKAAEEAAEEARKAYSEYLSTKNL